MLMNEESCVYIVSTNRLSYPGNIVIKLLKIVLKYSALVDASEFAINYGKFDRSVAVFHWKFSPKIENSWQFTELSAIG